MSRTRHLIAQAVFFLSFCITISACSLSQAAFDADNTLFPDQEDRIPELFGLADALDELNISPLEKAYFDLEYKIRELEKEPSTREKAMTTVMVMLLDLTFEMVHLWKVQSFSPEYYYNMNDPPYLPQSFARFREVFFDAITQKHVPILSTGLFSWLGQYGGALPNISGDQFYYRLGVITGLTTICYRFLTTRTVYQGSRMGSWKMAALHLLDISGLLLLRDTPEHDQGRDWFMATTELDYAKPILQAAAITLMTFWNISTRFQHRSELQDLKFSLKLARDRLQKYSLQNKSQDASESELLVEEELNQEESDTTKPLSVHD